MRIWIDSLTKQFFIKAICFSQEIFVSWMLVNLPCSTYMSNHLVPIYTRSPTLTLVVRKFVPYSKFHSFTPSEYISICIMRLVCHPGSCLDLEDCIISVHAQKVIDSCLCMWVHFVSLTDLGVIHQVNGIQVVVNLNNILVGATEVRNFFVKQLVHS